MEMGKPTVVRDLVVVLDLKKVLATAARPEYPRRLSMKMESQARHGSEIYRYLPPLCRLRDQRQVEGLEARRQSQRGRKFKLGQMGPEILGGLENPAAT